MNELAEIRNEIMKLVDMYSNIKFTSTPFSPGESVVPVSGKVLDAGELKNMIDASLDGWLTTGRFNDAFEKN